jgi:hypothetical protein
VAPPNPKSTSPLVARPPAPSRGAINRTQRLVLGFFFCVWVSLVLILVLSPGVYRASLKLVPGDPRLVTSVFLTAVTALIVLPVVGVIRRWRWVYWLVLVAFFAGALRLAASLLQLIGWLPAGGPVWYESLQGMIGAVQFGIALAMIVGYRKAGVWGDF